jgi:uridine kinase
MVLTEMTEITEKIDQLLTEKPFVTVAIDGMAASGKSTAAEQLRQRYSGAVIHMDDFYVPLPLRTEERYQKPGANVHYERFAEEVLPGLKTGKTFDYRIFSCDTFDYTHWVRVEPNRLYLVEGAYSLHPYFDYAYDLTVFFEITPELQRERIRKRNGEEKLQMFMDRWIPLETAYLEAYRIKEKCDMTVSVR